MGSYLPLPAERGNERSGGIQTKQVFVVGNADSGRVPCIEPLQFIGFNVDGKQQCGDE